MSNRSWFYASNGQQQGPYPEAQLRDLITRGTVGRGHVGLDRGDVGLAAGRRHSRPGPRRLGPSLRPAPRWPTAGCSRRLWRRSALDRRWHLGVARAQPGVHIGMVLVIPAPWVAIWFYRWIFSRRYVPGRPNLASREAMTIAPGFLVRLHRDWHLAYVSAAELTTAISADPRSGCAVLDVYSLDRSQSASNGQPLDCFQRQSRLGYLGWQLLRPCPSSPSLAGPGFHGLDALDLPEYPGHAARSHLHRQRTGVSVANHRVRDRQHLHHPDPVGVSLVLSQLAGVRSTLANARARARPSCERRESVHLALAHRAFLSHRRHQRAVRLEDQAAGQSAAVLRAR